MCTRLIIDDGINNLKNIIIRQLDSYWINYNRTSILQQIEPALDQLKRNMSGLSNACKYVHDDNGDILFSPYNTVAYSVYLYILSRELHKAGANKEAGLIYYLNKIFHSVDWLYEIELPNHFWVEHPLGSVLGRAQYGDYFFFMQGITVGGNDIGVGHEIKYPVLGNNVIMCSNSSVIGDCQIGNNVVISSGCMIKNQNIPSDTLVFGKSPNLIFKDIENGIDHYSIWKKNNVCNSLSE